MIKRKVRTIGKGDAGEAGEESEEAGKEGEGRGKEKGGGEDTLF